MCICNRNENFHFYCICIGFSFLFISLRWDDITISSHRNVNYRNNQYWNKYEMIIIIINRNHHNHHNYNLFFFCKNELQWSSELKHTYIAMHVRTSSAKDFSSASLLSNALDFVLSIVFRRFSACKANSL